MMNCALCEKEASHSRCGLRFPEYIRRVLFDLCQFAEKSALPEDALSATEFRRGLAVAEPRRPTGWTEPDRSVSPVGSSLLGANTHYLGLTAFDERDLIAATLYCANGTVTFQWLPLTPEQVRRAARRRLDQWLERGGTPIRQTPSRSAAAVRVSAGTTSPGDHEGFDC